jgi:hydroxybutyrate-dimer hydrolase
MAEMDYAEVRQTAHRVHDDLLSAGLGLAGLAGAPAAFGDPLHPTAEELRRRAIQTSWKGIADLGPLGGYGTVYGGVPDVPGREFQAFARIPGAHSPHRVLLQLPDRFDTQKRCLVVTASSGSRGIYGAIALAGAWGLPRGCAVAYTDKGTGSGYFDYADNSGVALDGRRAKRGDAVLEFQPPPAPPTAGIAVHRPFQRRRCRVAGSGAGHERFFRRRGGAGAECACARLRPRDVRLRHRSGDLAAMRPEQ